MRVLVILTCLFGAVLAVPDEYGVGQRKFKVPDKLFLERQRDLLELFQNIFEPGYNAQHQKFANYSVEENINDYINSAATRKFVSLYKEGLLPRGEIFTLFHSSHLVQAISLFKLFYYARDFDTLYKTAVWARNNVNEGLFVYAFSTALAHRDDTFTFIIPPIYEINPYYFFYGAYIDKAQRYKQQNVGDKRITIYVDYFFNDFNLNNEQSLQYFLEDVGLNAFYYYCNIYYPFWLEGDEFKLKNDRRGEQYYYLYQQLLARYYLERLSNNFGEIEFFNYEDPFKNGYYSFLRYPNGAPFPNRPHFARLSTSRSNGYDYTKVQDFERRLRDTIDSSYIFTKNRTFIDLLDSDQTNILGNLVESNPDSLHLHFYGPWQIHARRFLGYSYQDSEEDKVAPSTLEHFETALRDPAFYQLYKKIVLFFQQYKALLPPYTYKELYFPGVKIGKVDFDPLFTYFDEFESDVSNAVYHTPKEQSDSFDIKMSRNRLNHKPFTYRISVNSDKVNDVIVRVYLGPKHDENGRLIDINENRMNFVELDTFRYKLQAGENLIERNARQFYWYVPDRTTSKDLYRKVVEAIDNRGQLELDASEAFYGFPNRLLLPKGKRGGQLFQIYVIINQYRAPERPEVQQDFYFHRVGTGMNYMDDYAFGFPFDRSIVTSEFQVPNSKFEDVVITHKNIREVEDP